MVIRKFTSRARSFKVSVIKYLEIYLLVGLGSSFLSKGGEIISLVMEIFITFKYIYERYIATLQQDIIYGSNSYIYRCRRLLIIFITPMYSRTSHNP